MSDKLTKRAIIIISSIFIIINTIAIAYEFYYLMILPAALLLVYFLFFHLDVLLLIITFLTPLSITLEQSDFNIGVALPTEPLMFSVLFLFVFKIIQEGYPKKILRHPITIAIIINLSWMLITSLTSSEPVISIKYLTSRLWFVVSFFFFGVLLFSKYKNIRRFLWAYIIPLCVVMIYTLLSHIQYNMSEETAHWVMNPFFKDHTSYGALLAMFFPVIIGFIFDKYQPSKVEKNIAIALSVLFFIATVFSYTRAAWVGLVASFALWVAIIMKLNIKHFVLMTVGALCLFLTFHEQIIMSLEKNRQDSSDNLAEHVQSISNISSDASNLERLNRWSSAFRMFKERPVFGWGPGTYQFKYGSFQLSTEKTIISTNFGNQGNAHSEYIGPLAESGVLGSLSFIAIVVTVIYTSFSVYYQNKKNQVKLYSLLILLGFITYVIHGMLNNFLDLDKAAVPFWGFAAILVALDIYHNPKNNLNQ